MRYQKYNYQIRYEVVMAKVKNPYKSFERLSIEYNIVCPETIRYWYKCYKNVGDKSFKDKRHRVANKDKVKRWFIAFYINISISGFPYFEIIIHNPLCG